MVVLGLASALAFGLCDFVAGLASRRLSFWWVALLSLVASVVGAWLLVLVAGDELSVRAVLWGLGAGGGVATGATALYRGYGRGQMAVAGPLSALGAAALPAVVGAPLGERLPAAALAGVILALPAIWWMSSTRADGRGTARVGVPEGLVSG